MGRIAYIKLRSRKGASITFALLAFLVCAVISAVLLASASAAAGRLSGLADSDQRYYAVTSAAQLFCDELDGQSFTIKREYKHVTKSWAEYEVVEGLEVQIGSGDGINAKLYNDTLTIRNVLLPRAEPKLYDIRREILNADGSVTKTTPNNQPDTIKSLSLLSEAAMYYVMQGKTDEVIWELGELARTTEFDWGGNPLLIEATETGTLDAACLKVYVFATMAPTGDITLEFRNVDGEPFTVYVTLAASVSGDREPNEDTKTTYSVGAGSRENSYKMTTTTTQTMTKTETISWTVKDVQKSSAKKVSS